MAIRNVKQVEKRPEQRMKEINEKLKEASDKYYLESTSIMSDYEYDALKDELAKLEEENGTLDDSMTDVVGASSYSKSNGKKEQHEEKALSLKKTKSRSELANWLDKQKGCLSWKLDGLTLVVTYDNGQLTKVVTRGDGITGTVVNNLIGAVLGMPLRIKFKGHLVVRGEAVITYSKFNEINSKLSNDSKYENPRNLASGTVTTNDGQIASERGLCFYAFELVKTSMRLPSNSFYQNLDWLRSQGFLVVEHVYVTRENLENKISIFDENISTFDIPSDGLVLQYDDIEYGNSLGLTGHHPRSAMAFKWQDETKSTVITDITWQVGRTGTVNPVVHFNKVYLEGSNVTQATANNISFMEKHHLTVGSSIEVYKANKIIPTIARNTNPVGQLVIPRVCPSCGKPLQIVTSKNAKILYCQNKNCLARDIRHLAQYVSKGGMDIVGLAANKLSALVSAGYIHNYLDIYRLEQHPEIANEEGFGKSSYKNMIDSINASRETTLGRYLYAYGIYMVGESVAKDIEKHVKSIDNFVKAMDSGYDFTQISGIGEKINTSLHEWWRDNRDLFIAVAKELKFKNGVIEVKVATGLAGKTLCFTGDTVIFKNRNEVKEFIESNGGKLTGSVSKKTDYLVTNDTTSGSSKNLKAKELGIPVITEQQLVDLGK